MRSAKRGSSGGGKHVFASEFLLLSCLRTPQHPSHCSQDKNIRLGERRADSWDTSHCIGCSELSEISRFKWNRFNYYQEGRKRPIKGENWLLPRQSDNTELPPVSQRLGNTNQDEHFYPRPRLKFLPTPDRARREDDTRI